jgi:hypothetical protein
MQDYRADCHFNEVQAARYLGKSLRWLQYQISSPNPPPSYKIGKSRIFKKSELDRWLEQFRAPADVDRVVGEILSELKVGK